MATSMGGVVRPVRHRHSLSLVLLATLALAACAAHTKPYVSASKVVLPVSQGLQRASTVADLAYAQRAVTGFTGADLNRTRQILEPIAMATRAAEDALIAWPIDRPFAPPELQQLATALTRGADDVVSSLPESPTRAAVQGFLAVARAT